MKKTLWATLAAIALLVALPLIGQAAESPAGATWPPTVQPGDGNPNFHTDPGKSVPITITNPPEPPANSGGGGNNGDKNGQTPSQPGAGAPGETQPGRNPVTGDPARTPAHPGFGDPTDTWPIGGHGGGPGGIVIPIESPGGDGQPGMTVDTKTSNGYERDKSAPFQYDWALYNVTTGAAYKTSTDGPSMTASYTVGTWQGTSTPWVMYHDYYWAEKEITKTSEPGTGTDETGDLGRTVIQYKEYVGDPYPGIDANGIAHYKFTVSTDEAGRPFTLPNDANNHKVTAVDELVK